MGLVFAKIYEKPWSLVPGEVVMSFGIEHIYAPGKVPIPLPSQPKESFTQALQDLLFFFLFLWDFLDGGIRNSLQIYTRRWY